MKITQFARVSLSVALLAAIAAVAGCAKDDPASYVASAKRYVEKSDYKAALIEVKNALQRDPDNPEARLIHATALLETGDPAGAEAEVRKAIALNIAADSAYPVLARAIAAQGDFRRLAGELGAKQLASPAADAAGEAADGALPAAAKPISATSLAGQVVWNSIKDKLGGKS